LKRLIWSKSARRELFAIAAHYDQFDPELPDRLLSRIEKAPLLLLEFPGIGSPTERRGIRKWRVRHTPFLLFYVARGNAIEVIRVRHVRSDGDESKDRS
jgi:toxin ParE1/3/4